MPDDAPAATATRPDAAPGPPPPENLLAREASPYLLQHRDNPVHWRPWGPAALAEARATGKPVLLSVGYAACHWCHVMAHESFEDAATAAVMNDLFVNVKVDREERPEIDAAYMNALHLLGEQGGWPLTMFLTPDGEPFWGGTYFPPEPRYGRPGFRDVLRAVADAHARDGEKVASNARALREGLARLSRAAPGALPGREAISAAADAVMSLQDPVQGGLRGAPKFPNPSLYRLLHTAHVRHGRDDCGAALRLLLLRMSQGGIWDHLGGGFARYSVDGRWLVPHFEKMLYDNAQLLELLAHSHASRPHPLLAKRAGEIVGWLEREMVAHGGAWASSLDADSEGEEGRFYVWSEAEVDAALGGPDDAAPFKRAFDVTPEGNWEGKTVLNRSRRPDHPAPDEAALDAARARLFEVREGRVRPGRDDKVLADWNGLCVAGLVRASAVFGRPEWLGIARRVFDAVVADMSAPDGRLMHAARDGRPSAAGLLDDHAAMARAALALHGATGEAADLDRALAWARACDAHFAAPGGGYFTSADDATDVPFRTRTATDNATPAATGLLAEVQARLFHATGDDAWARAAEATIAAFTGRADALPSMPGLLVAADLLAEGASVVVAGDPDSTEARALAAAALAAPDPAVTVLRAPAPDALPPGHPAHGKGPVGGRPAAAYVCRTGVCGLPVATPEALAQALAPAA